MKKLLFFNCLIIFSIFASDINQESIQQKNQISLWYIKYFTKLNTNQKQILCFMMESVYEAHIKQTEPDSSTWSKLYLNLNKQEMVDIDLVIAAFRDELFINNISKVIELCKKDCQQG